MHALRTRQPIGREDLAVDPHLQATGFWQSYEHPTEGTLRMPSFPIIPQLLLPGGALPLPTKYRITFGQPMFFEGDPDDDDAVIDEKVQLVRDTVQAMVTRGVRQRKSVFFG